ncbi:MAG: mechanosensitive ion channel protein MscS [Myxococcales bacterium SG8_38]|nr:MAG: mechanosensitive ion channel protein MscS [Myxococcales bacterium SG8_38]
MDFQSAYQKLIQKLWGWVETFVEMLPNLAVAFLVIVLFWITSIAAAAATQRALIRLRTRPSIQGLIVTLLRIAILFTGLMMALGILNLDKALTSILAGAGIVGLALGFAFQDLAANFISGVGLSLHRTHPFKVGDLIETNDVFGTVQQITLRTTELRTLDGKQITIPNKHVYQDRLTNHSFSGERRVDLSCGISYGDDLEKVRKISIEAIEGIENRNKDKKVDLYFQDFGDSSINFVVCFWIRFQKQTDYLEAMSDAVMRLKKAFDQNDITIPFPIRTLDFGIKGGERLGETLSKVPVKLAFPDQSP